MGLLLKVYFNHYLEMFLGYLKGQYIRITNPRRYFLLRKMRGDYSVLLKKKVKLQKQITSILKSNKIQTNIISRIKTIGSIDRKERYSKILKKSKNYSSNDVIGLKIITKNKKDCYKVLKLIMSNFVLQKVEDMQNPEDFFKEPKIMRNTNSIAKNHIFVKIIFNGSPVHIILMQRSDVAYVHKQRKIYIKFVKNVIKSN